MTANDTSESSDPSPKARGKLKAKRDRREKPYPGVPFADVISLAESIFQFAGDKIRRLTLFEKLDRSPSSSLAREQITNASKYGLIKGNYNAEWLELTPSGKVACDPALAERDRHAARCELGIRHVPVFAAMYDAYVGKRLPAPEVLKDFLDTTDFAIQDANECIDTFMVNCKALEILRPIAGAETLVPIEQVLEAKNSSSAQGAHQTAGLSGSSAQMTVGGSAEEDWNKLCFYITPIGHDGSEERKHADLFMGSLIEPAISELGLKVVRADQIGQAGIITSQVLEHIRRARLVIADLSTLNPNVFYEMALRHACRLPVVQVIRKADRIPFDTGQVRTVVIDTTDIYSLIPRLRGYIAEIAMQARSALENPTGNGNPVSTFYPAFFDGLFADSK